MDIILYLRQRVLGLCARYEAFLTPIVKFLTMMAVLLTMNWHLGYRYALMRWILVILVSLICSLLPWAGMTAAAGMYLLGHVSALTWEGTAILVLVMVTAAMIHYLFLPGGSVIVLLLPLAYYLKLPYLVPILAGLFAGTLGLIPVAEGVVVYGLLQVLEKNAGMFLDPNSNILSNVVQILDGMKNQQMFMTLIVFSVSTLAICGIRYLQVDHAGLIASVLGGCLMLVAFLLGGYVMSLSISYPGLVIGILVSVLLSLVIQFWAWGLDYSRAEYLEYEDDEYVYYVKAVPKIHIAEAEKKVYRIREDEEDEYEDNTTNNDA